MRIAAIVYIILSVLANFIFNSLPVFVLAIFSFPVLLWLLLKKHSKIVKPTIVSEKKKDTTTTNDTLPDKQQYL